MGAVACETLEAKLQRVLPVGQPDAERTLGLAAVEPRIPGPPRRTAPVGQRNRLNRRNAVAAAGPAGKNRLGETEPRGLTAAGDVIDAGTDLCRLIQPPQGDCEQRV